MTRAKKARSDFRGGQGRVPRRPMPREGVVATMRVRLGRGGGIGGGGVGMVVETSKRGGFTVYIFYKMFELCIKVQIDYELPSFCLLASTSPPEASGSFVELWGSLSSFSPCNLLNPSATFLAASSARFSASLMPTVSSLPKSHASFSMRVKDKISSAART